MEKNASAPRPCGAACPLVCLVPAAMPQPGVTSQPMQMFMVAPMAAPVMMPALGDGSMGSALPNFDGYMNPGMVGFAPVAPSLSSAAYSWTGGPWQQSMTESFLGMEAPHQLPMEAVVSQEPFADIATEKAHCTCQTYSDDATCEVEVPTQMCMGTAISQPTEKVHGTNPCTLRRRRAAAPGFNQESCIAGVDDTIATEAQDAGGDADTDATDAQAQEIASRLISQLRAGGHEEQAAVASFERLSFSSKVTSRAAQLILQQTSMNEAAAFAAGLRGHVRNAVQSKHANHVVQKITEVMPVSRARFIVDELKGFGLEIAQHVFGCRVLCRILEHLSEDDANTIELVEEILADLKGLCSHSYGSFVVRHLLEFGSPEHRHQVAVALRSDLMGFAKHKFGSHVVEATLRHAGLEDQRVLSRELMRNKERLMTLAANQFGRHVVRALLSTPGELKREAVDALRPMEDQLKASRYGKSVMQTLRAAATS